MKNLLHVTTAIASIESLQRSALRQYLFFIPLLAALASFAFPLTARAVDPPPDGDYGNGNTAEGLDALFSLTPDSFNNTAVGTNALYDVGFNAGLGVGSDNTAVGTNACRIVIESNNTAVGSQAFSYADGSYNTALGSGALGQCTGSYNTATGNLAMHGDSTFTWSQYNTADGALSLYHIDEGNNNVAVGFQALFFNTNGDENTGIGLNALINTTGSRNTALGAGAGGALTTGSDNIAIGNSGVAGDSGKIRIGITGVHTNTYLAGIYGSGRSRTSVPVYVDSAGRLATSTSSARFKEAIKPMDKASDALFALKPVTFNYKKELDPDGVQQFGLVAEEVEKVNPDLVVHDDQGKVYTVRYDAVNAMLLNEFLKEHEKVRKLEANDAEQQREIKALVVTVKEQSAQIQKVSAQIEMSKPITKVVLNNQ